MPAQNPSPASEPDNSRVNARDKSGSTLRPVDQGAGEQDRKITQQIRQAMDKDGSLSFTAKNAKIITINGKVTLRGVVKTNAESIAIEAAAKKVAGASQVDNFLEIRN
ncbi:MAG TPA: BON domain-containing protein [Polyangiaceae bacterium]|nr:BON domain-containing protein [Polyangiaceae bacterium]